MKRISRLSIVTCLSLIVMALAFTSCDNDDNDKTDLTFSPSNKVEVAVGENIALTVNGGAAPYLAQSSDTKIATTTVDKSTITIKGVAKGTATIVVMDKDKKSGKIAVTVKDAATLHFDKNSVEVDATKEAIISVTGGTAPYAAAPKDADIASVTVKDYSITVKGLKAGTTTITVTDKEKKNSGTFTVKVK